jgi:hypothetical protein
MFRSLKPLLCVLLLGGCSYLSNWSPFAKEVPPADWQRPSGTEDQTSADLTACRQEANAIIQRDASIDRDVASAREPAYIDNGRYDFVPTMDAYSRDQRYRRITNDCMRQRGYVLPEKSPIEQ